MLSAKRISILSGLILGSSIILGGCGNGTNLVPAAPVTTVGGTAGYCTPGSSYYPSNPYGTTYGNTYGSTYGGCNAGYIYSGSMCICNSAYNNGYGSPYGVGGCPSGQVMYNGTCMCPSGQVYSGGYCHY